MRKIGFIVCSSLLLGAAAASAHTNLAEAYSAMGFNPSAPGNAVVVLFSDPHLNLNPEGGTTPGVITTNLDPRLVNRVNAMNPPPARIIVAGDVGTGYSTCPGQLPDWPTARKGASNELSFWLPAIQAFTNIAQTNILWIPGNHDQDPRETNAELFCEMFPNMPPYQVFDLAGVRFFLLNGGNQGFPSESQRHWLKEEVALTSPTQTVAVVIHQQPFLSGRGIPLMLRECFQDWQTPWWAFHGHAHYFGGAVFDIGRSNVTMSGVGSVNTNHFNGQSMNPGFMVLCLSNGIAGRVYHHFLDSSFEVVQEPDWQHPLHYAAAFEEVKGLLWRREKTPGTSPPEVIVTNIWYDAGYDYAGPTELQWALPLGRHANQATHFLLSSYLNGSNSISFSTDRTNWIEVPIPGRTNLLYAFPIPPSVAGMATGYARFYRYSGDIHIDAWGLATINPPPWITFPQLAPVPDQAIVAGRILTITSAVSDPYAPPDVLTFSLINSPAGASVDPHSGLLSWQPSIPNSPTITTVTVKVSDNGTVPMCATQQVSVAVARPAVPAITSPGWTAGQYRFTISGDTNLGYTVWTSTNLTDWVSIFTVNPIVLPFQITDPNSLEFPQRMYRVSVAPWVVWDAEATNFLARAGIPLSTNNTIPTAINSLVLSAKAHGWWAKCDAIYPFVGATAASHAPNLKSTNYNILWHGAVIHDARGVTGDGLTGYGDTQFNPRLVNEQFRQTSAHLFVYSGTKSLPDYGLLLGSAAGDYSSCAILWSVGGFVGGGLNEVVYAGIGIYTGDLSGPMLVSRTDFATEFLAVGDSLSSGMTTAGSVPNANVGLLAVIHDDGSVAHYCPANLRGATIGHGLTPEQWETLRQDWEEFETVLGRKAP